MNPRRGEIWWVALDPTLGSEIRKTRPCVVLTTNVLNERRHTVVVVPLSSASSPAPPIQVPLRCLDRPAVAITDQIRAITKGRLRTRIGMAAAADLLAIELALKQILELV